MTVKQMRQKKAKLEREAEALWPGRDVRGRRRRGPRSTAR